jgi:hypothetical protein
MSSTKKRPATYAVQEDADLAACVDSRLLAAQLADFAEDADGLVGELLEVGSSDARGCFGHFCFLVCVLFSRLRNRMFGCSGGRTFGRATRGKTC